MRNQDPGIRTQDPGCREIEFGVWSSVPDGMITVHRSLTTHNSFLILIEPFLQQAAVPGQVFHKAHVAGKLKQFPS